MARQMSPKTQKKPKISSHSDEESHAQISPACWNREGQAKTEKKTRARRRGPPRGARSPGVAVVEGAPTYSPDRIETRAAAGPPPRTGKRRARDPPTVGDKSDLAGNPKPTTPATRRRPWRARPSTRRSAPWPFWSRPSGRRCRAGVHPSPRCSAGRGATTYNP